MLLVRYEPIHIQKEEGEIEREEGEDEEKIGEILYCRPYYFVSNLILTVFPFALPFSLPCSLLPCSLFYVKT